MLEDHFVLVLLAVAGGIRYLRYFVTDVSEELKHIVSAVTRCYRCFVPLSKEDSAEAPLTSRIEPVLRLERPQESTAPLEFRFSEAGETLKAKGTAPLGLTSKTLIVGFDPQTSRQSITVGTRRGWQVYEADSKTSAINLLESSIEFDQVVIDISTTAEADLVELVTRFGKEKTLLISANDDSERARNLGCRYLQKPFSIQSLFTPRLSRAA